MKSLINTFKLCQSLLAVGFATGNKVSEKDGVVDDFNMESKECTIVANADAIDVVVADKLLAVGNVFKAFGILDFFYNPSHRVKHLA